MKFSPFYASPLLLAALLIQSAAYAQTPNSNDSVDKGGQSTPRASRREERQSRQEAAPSPSEPAPVELAPLSPAGLFQLELSGDRTEGPAARFETAPRLTLNGAIGGQSYDDEHGFGIGAGVNLNLERLRLDADLMGGMRGALARLNVQTDYGEFSRRFSRGRAANATLRITPADARLILGSMGFALAAEPNVSGEVRINHPTVGQVRFLMAVGVALGIQIEDGDVSALVRGLVRIEAGYSSPVIPTNLLGDIQAYVDFTYRRLPQSTALGSEGSLQAGIRLNNSEGCERGRFGLQVSGIAGLRNWGLAGSIPLGENSCAEPVYSSQELAGSTEELPSEEALEENAGSAGAAQ